MLKKAYETISARWIVRPMCIFVNIDEKKMWKAQQQMNEKQSNEKELV